VKDFSIAKKSINRWMKSSYRKCSHTITRLTCHLVWDIKYRYQVLKGDVQIRCKELLIQICESEGVEILKGVISSDHVHMHIEYVPKTSLSMLLKQMKGCTSRKLQQEFPKLQERYWGIIFGPMVMELGAQII
jgi:putative transposase